jgi:hypothetical protein
MTLHLRRWRSEVLKTLLSMSFLLSFSTSGISATMTIEQLRDVCAGPNGSAGQTACAAYLMGVVHGLQLGTSWTKRGEPFCIPESISSPQAIQLFNKSVTQSLDLQAAVAPHWAAALANAFPCRK